MKKLLILLSHTEKGGGEVVAFTLAKFIDPQRYIVHIGHVDFRQGEFINSFCALGFTPVDFKAGRLRNILRLCATVFRIRSFIKKNSIDLILCTGAHNQIYAWLTRCLIPVKIITYAMNYYDPDYQKNRFILKVGLSCSPDAYCVPSRFCYDSLRKLVSSKIPVRLMYHGIDLNDLEPGRTEASEFIRQSLNLAQTDTLIMLAGRLQPWKGQEDFVSCAVKICQKFSNVYFCIVGGALFGMAEDFPNIIREQVRQSNLEKRIFIVGFKENSADWLRAADICVNASREPETFGLSVVEAMALAKPVIATSIGAPAEIIQHGENGLLFKPKDVSELTAHIEKLLENPRYASNLGAAASSTIRSSFTARRMCEQLESFIEEVITQ